MPSPSNLVLDDLPRTRAYLRFVVGVKQAKRARLDRALLGVVIMSMSIPYMAEIERRRRFWEWR